MNLFRDILWRGEKSYEFLITVNFGDNLKLIKIRSILDKPGITVKIDEADKEKTKQMLEKEIKIQKTTLYTRKAEGKIIPKSLLETHEDAKRLFESLENGDTKLYLVKVVVDAGKVSREEITNLIKEARATMPFADPEKYKKKDE